MIDIRNVSKTFEGGSGSATVAAVRDVSLHIDKGDIFGIIGYSGAGKSTLVRCINLLERPESGSVTVDGVELTSLTQKRLREERKKIGMIFQLFNLMPSRTVGDNIAFALDGKGLTKEEKSEKIKKLLTLVDIPEKINSYPSQLSGGQKQRVAIARALANDPKVLLCDEATSALDPQSTQSILELIRKLNAELGITVVIITHSMSVIKEICNRVAVMEDGKVVESGDVYGIFANPGCNITKEFIDTTSNIRKIDELIAQESPLVRLNSGERIVKFTYGTSNVDDALISVASRKYGVDLISSSKLEIINDKPLGTLIVLLGGNTANIDKALKYFNETSVRTEIIRQECR